MRNAALLSLALLSCAKAPPPAPLNVAAASDLSGALKDVGDAFTAESGVPVVLTFGSSGQLATQIEAGAPFDVFAAANVKYVDDLLAKKKCNARGIYGRGRLVVLGSTAAPTLDALRRPSFVKIAIANPEHAPYGIAAKEALEAAGVWPEVQPRIVYGENARQAMQMLTSGNVEAALVPLGLARSSTAAQGHYSLVDSSLHKPLDQAVTACGPRAELGQKFVTFMLSDRGRALLQKHGFEHP